MWVEGEDGPDVEGLAGVYGEGFWFAEFHELDFVQEGDGDAHGGEVVEGADADWNRG